MHGGCGEGMRLWNLRDSTCPLWTKHLQYYRKLAMLRNFCVRNKEGLLRRKQQCVVMQAPNAPAPALGKKKQCLSASATLVCMQSAIRNKTTCQIV